jgi:hypothetical protein
MIDEELQESVSAKCDEHQGPVSRNLIRCVLFFEYLYLIFSISRLVFCMVSAWFEWSVRVTFQVKWFVTTCILVPCLGISHLHATDFCSKFPIYHPRF